MPPEILFSIQLLLGYLAWALIVGAYLLPKLKQMGQLDALRVIAAVHSFRFFGLVFILPGVVGQNLPADFAKYAAYGDFATGLLALSALLVFRVRQIFLTLVVAFNVVGVLDLIIDYWHAVQSELPRVAGQLGASYAIPVIYVPFLMITHLLAFYLLARPPRQVHAEAVKVH
jgi:hypothetical protein